MNIVYLCHYFSPEISAPSARLNDLCSIWVTRGHSVTVVTGFPNHPTGVLRREDRRKLWAEERMNGIRVLRNWLYATPNEGFLRKTLGHLSFMVTAVLFGLPRLGKTDVIIASSPTFFSVVSAWLMAVVKRVPFVFEVRDLWPAVFVDLGVLKNRHLISLLEAIEMFLYRRATLIVTVTDSFRQILIRRGIPNRKIITVTNGADIEFFRSSKRDSFRDDNGLRDKLIVMYLGAHGISHSLQTTIRCAELLRGHEDISFVLVGEGSDKKNLIELAQNLNLTNVLFTPSQPRERVPSLYSTADVCLVTLRDVPLFTTFIPSKMFEIMAAGRPIIAAVRGEAREILERSGSAVIVDPEDPQAMADAVLRVTSSPSERRKMGDRGRDFVVKHYGREALAGTYEQALAEIVSAKPTDIRRASRSDAHLIG